MKPLIIIEVPDCHDPENVDKIEKWAYEETREGHVLSGYEILVVYGMTAKVYYPYNTITFYYQKLKAWLFLKIWKKRTS